MLSIFSKGYMRRHADDYEAFVIGDDLADYISYSSSEEKLTVFCSREVEPMGREVEQPQIMALCSYLGVNARLEYLDGR